MSKKFTRNIEDFTCENCGQKVVGNGYTNHCTSCLYSKDVDINPGDRAAECRGLMQPIAIEAKLDHFIITHECLTCGKQRKNKTSELDDTDQIFKIMKQLAENSIR